MQAQLHSWHYHSGKAWGFRASVLVTEDRVTIWRCLKSDYVEQSHGRK